MKERSKHNIKIGENMFLIQTLYAALHAMCPTPLIYFLLAANVCEMHGFIWVLVLWFIL